MDTPPLAPGLYIVATPIGNLGDITARAADILARCDVIACEDTRVTGKLLNHLGIRKAMRRYDDHASADVRERLLGEMAEKSVVLVSDAGTPLISDPGYRLVREARERGLAVTSLPGPSAMIVALTLAGLPTDRFMFAGFLPSKDKARGDVLAELAATPATLVFYETGPRLVASLTAMEQHLPGRELAVARELTKLHEECRSGTPEELIAHYSAHPPKGEIVLLAGPPPAPAAPAGDDVDTLLRAALEHLSPSQAAGQVAKAHGLDRKALYARAMALKEAP
ncbi:MULTISPECIES: 16S rRNA (cytidine(1402)-2'-O)-methyltransferase [unclassified Novosphingobium]|uniref:16S rRNA (cytidine(1402)-2'-O)-methyltransferase n=1 Tax=unclassified Novosphingobium TaxID=2644732 RepID=UPI00149478D5|nr:MULTISPECIES: 16S rRNA (cytidine(1402)-2'-O)-methyltransferase [unclassified Novosphingobium]MBB3358435.1 16S rRNA (cytidine1402-2'-O)-methyltransferase [Novosphingobium sp. BK256]MBB3374796.1 16S rRNA (cytidine1402-2'-O)-methyltransferase [Novosphingobium sp. BK280]MBB3379515.1 16S rRNA (cytidine1402-2'-O)-methyltransferase [Novosphingobium sp. BK258]MBB3421210.1 16S rRNA (cytidine1402-2'-O)-methyltransferase [Novosphingobium sp. BK267]MBB3449217.1 16S rRNA (cytidine1402-2'-O)-methyltransf